MAAISKGWKRLLIVLSVLWLVIASGFVIAESQSINVFDQFDKQPSQYVFWQWAPVDLLLKDYSTPTPTKEQQMRELNPRVVNILAMLFVPTVGLWLVVWSFGWVREGFN